jgi:hypothetical protein
MVMSSNMMRVLKACEQAAKMAAKSLTKLDFEQKRAKRGSLRISIQQSLYTERNS